MAPDRGSRRARDGLWGMSFLPFVSLVLDCPMDIMMSLTSCSPEKLLLVSAGTLMLLGAEYGLIFVI
jgi:hypothetical protein